MTTKEPAEKKQKVDAPKGASYGTTVSISVPNIEYYLTGLLHVLWSAGFGNQVVHGGKLIMFNTENLPDKDVADIRSRLQAVLSSTDEEMGAFHIVINFYRDLSDDLCKGRMRDASVTAFRQGLSQMLMSRSSFGRV